jgi:prepilin-type N-terminal cleavage/methylation domain-containing protein
MRANEKGFTLMELMVVIVIVAILAAVAVPLYINYVRDAQRTEAKGAIGAVVTAEQTFYQVHNIYTSDTFVPITNPPTGTQILNCDLTDALHNWAITVTATGDGTDGFTVNAVGREGTPAATLTQTLTFSRTSAPVWDPE